MMLTPVERHGDYWLKRDDLYTRAGVRGGKARSCGHIADQAVAAGIAGLVTAGHASSPQVELVAAIGAAAGLQVRAHVPASRHQGVQIHNARALGAEIVEHRPAYTVVLDSRSRRDAAERGWLLVPFGMECEQAVESTAAQVENLPAEVRRLVVPVGSGMTLAGILTGLQRTGRSIEVIGVIVGSDPSRRLARYAPLGWQSMTTLVKSTVPYSTHVMAEIDGVTLDPVYEAKTVAYLQPDDALWLVGIRGVDGGAS